jgi:hypothetical protein
MCRITILLLTYLISFSHSGYSQLKVPDVSKPWTYWWWMGSSVTRQGITEHLEDMKTAGIGGVHIIPIYGEKGDENNYIPYLSPGWMDMLKYTTEEAAKLGMGVDMTSGTGWPFGGPEVTASDAAIAFYAVPVEIMDQVNILNYAKPKTHSKLIALAAYDDMGYYIDLTSPG